MKARTASLVMAAAAIAALFLPGGWTWLALILAAAALAVGIVSLRHHGAEWQAITGVVFSSGVTLMLVAIAGRILWLNVS